MISLKALMALPFLYSPAHPVKSTVCHELKEYPTKVDIVFTIAEPVFDYSKTKAQLTAERRDSRQEWINQHGLQTLWTADDLQTAGLASGAWGLRWGFRMDGENVDRFGSYYCLHFEEVELEIFYRTIIYIPKDYPQGSCKFDIIHEHEMAHHITNGLAVEKYINQLEKDMPMIVREMEAYGYVGRNSVDQRVEQLKQGIKDAVDIYVYEEMRKEMEANNDVIDSPESYAESSAEMKACEG